jgi:PAS domain S-box-containing protein
VEHDGESGNGASGEEIVRVISQLKKEIIERKWAEKKSRDALDYAESIIDSVKHPLVVLDEERKVVSANLAFYDLFTLTPGAVLGQYFLKISEGMFGFPEMRELLAARLGTEPRLAEVDRVFPFVGRKFLKAAVQGLQYNIKHLRFAFLTIEDVTEQKIAEGRLQKALQDKSALVKEVHHRVKNNLQILSSLLALQSSALVEPGERKILEDSRARVLAMAAVHESLSYNGSVEKVSLREPIARLISGIDSIYDDGVTSDIDVCDAEIGIDQATLLCLVLNEIVTNAHKHAFRGKERGQSVISINACLEDGELVIRAADNGVGLGGASVDTWSDTLGFTLVRNLVENQLGGAWSVKDFDGVHHELRIKIEEPDYLPSDPAADSPA